MNKLKRIVLIGVFGLLLPGCVFAGGVIGGAGSKAGGGGSRSDYIFDAASLQALETNFAPLVQVSSTTVKVFVRDFDMTTEEYANGKFILPSAVNDGLVTFKAVCTSTTSAASTNVGFTFGHRALDNGELFDGAYAEDDSGAVALNATAANLTEVTWTESMTSLGWAGGDLILFRLSRDVAVASNAGGDMRLFSFTVTLP